MKQFISVVAISLIGVAFWYLAGMIADILTPKILSWIRRRKKNLPRCPMLECCDSGCIYYSDKRRICMFADNPELLYDDPDQEVPVDE